MFYFSNFHSRLSYGILFWGTSGHSANVFIIQKRAIRIMMNADSGQSCRELFKTLNILPLYSQYILSLLLFVVKNLNMFQSNSTIHSFHTRHCSDLHHPQVNLTKVQKAVYYSGIRAYNCLPAGIKDLSNNFESFKSALKNCF